MNKSQNDIESSHPYSKYSFLTWFTRIEFSRFDENNFFKGWVFRYSQPKNSFDQYAIGRKSTIMTLDFSMKMKRTVEFV